MRWEGQVALIGGSRGVYRVLVGNLMEGDPLEDQGVDERIIIRWSFRKWDGGYGLD
jgi:hypothetical protein